jgi:hypothetical protein
MAIKTHAVNSIHRAIVMPCSPSSLTPPPETELDVEAAVP